MSKYKYTATCPDGTIVTRTTDRVYTHAVVGYWRDEEIPTYGMFEFCGRLDLAQKSYKKWTAQGAKVIVVPVDNPRPEPTNEPAAVDMGGDIEALAEALADDELDAEFAASMGIDAELQTAIDEGDFMEGYIARKITANNKQGNRPSVPSIHAEQDAQIARQNGTETKNQRIKRLEKRIASQERELIDLRFELSQLLGEDRE